jgi:hypothetical protein
MDVAVETRIRHLSLVDRGSVSAKAQAVDPRRGYLLGRLLLQDSITTTQHEAGLRYAEDVSRYFALVVGKFPSIRAQSLFTVPGRAAERDSHAGSAKVARATYIALRDALGASADISTGRRIEQVVRHVCVLDRSVSVGWPEPTLHLLRRGLNVLARFYRI